VRVTYVMRWGVLHSTPYCVEGVLVLLERTGKRPPSPRRATGLWVYITNGHHPPVRVTYVMRWGVLHSTPYCVEGVLVLLERTGMMCNINQLV